MTWNEHLTCIMRIFKSSKEENPMDVNLRLDVCTYDDLSFHFYHVYEKCESENNKITSIAQTL